MGNTSKKIVIMMATYNGERYLKDQLKSLSDQTFKNWDLYVSDDGSTDQTIGILKNFQKKDSRLRAILVNQGQHGAYNNFFNVMDHVKKLDTQYDYFFYCDQDDIWIQTKLENEIRILAQIDGPALCYSDLELINSDGKKLHKRMREITDIKLHNKYNIFFSYRYIWGTTMAHNLALWNLIYIDPEINNRFNISHDNYVGKYAAVYGKIIFISSPQVLYRRHGDNVSGIPGKYNVVKRLIVDLPKIINNHSTIYWEDLYFIKHAPLKNKFLDDLKKAINSGGNRAIKFMKNYDIYTSDSLVSRLSIKLILFGKLYKRTKVFNRKII